MIVALLLVMAAGIGLLPGAAHADEPSLPKLDPALYATEALGPARWTYPRSAKDEVRVLQAYREGAWRKIVAELGADIAPEIDIRVAINPEQMQALAPKGVILPGYADGIALPERGIVLLTLTEPETWLRPDMRSVLTHELSHIALHRAVKGAVIPRWFSEGVAVHQAGEHSLGRVKTLWEGTLQGQLLSLERMSTTFPSDHRRQVDLAYAQSADFVGFMLGGADERARFRVLLQGLAARTPFADAVTQAYHVPLGYMERQWRDTLTQRFGRWPALLMGLTFLWALGAILLVIAYVRARRRHAATLRRWEIEEAPLLQARVPPPPPATTTQVATLEDFFENRAKEEAGIPTVTHEGQNHTLH